MSLSTLLAFDTLALSLVAFASLHGLYRVVTPRLPSAAPSQDPDSAMLAVPAEAHQL